METRQFSQVAYNKTDFNELDAQIAEAQSTASRKRSVLAAVRHSHAVTRSAQCEPQRLRIWERGGLSNDAFVLGGNPNHSADRIETSCDMRLLLEFLPYLLISRLEQPDS